MAGLKPSSELISVMQEILKENPASASSIPITPSLSSSSPSLFSSEEISLLQSDFDQSYVTSLSLKLIKRYLTRDQKKRTLRSLLQGSSLKFPKFVIPTVEDSLEKKKRREYLQRRQQTKDYNLMIHGTNRVTSSEDTIASSLKSAKYTLAVSSNMIMTLIAMFGIGYYGAYKQGYSKHQCLIAGLVLATVMYLIEMTLYILRATKLEKAAMTSGTGIETKITEATPTPN